MLPKDIALRAERRKQQLREALQAGSNNLHNREYEVTGGNKGKLLVDEFPSWLHQSEEIARFPARPPRTAFNYNSPLRKSNWEPLWKYPPLPNVNTFRPAKDSQYYLSPYKKEVDLPTGVDRCPTKTVFDFVKESMLEPASEMNLPDVVTNKGLSPAAPMDIQASFLQKNTESQETKLKNTPVISPVSQWKPILESPISSKQPVNVGGFHFLNHKIQTLQDARAKISEGSSCANEPTEISPKSTNNPPANISSLRQSKLQSASSVNDLEDTYDMDQFLEAALGSQIDLYSSVVTDQKEDSSHQSMHNYQPVEKIPRCSTPNLDTSVMASCCSKPKTVEGLRKEVEKQRQLMIQTSKALDICESVKSLPAYVEGQRLLLLAHLRHQAALSEINNMHRPTEANSADSEGNLRVIQVEAPLKAYSRMQQHADIWFLCVLLCGDQVCASEAVPHREGSNKLTFSTPMELANLATSFTAIVEVYTLCIYPEKKDSVKTKIKRVYRFFRCKTKSFLKSTGTRKEVSCLRSPDFTLAGAATIKIGNLEQSSRMQITLDKVRLMSPLKGSLVLHHETRTTSEVEKYGFLNLQEVSGGCRIWQRRWCLLKGFTMSFWNSPTDTEDKDPLKVIRLVDCSPYSVQAAPRHLCPRSRTLMLETSQASVSQNIKPSELNCSLDHLCSRYFISCESAKDLQEWTAAINQVLNAISAWKLRRSCVDTTSL